MNRITRRNFLKGAGRLTILASAGTLAAPLTGCGLLGEDKGGMPLLSGSAYQELDPRRPERFINRLNLPRGDGFMGVLDLGAGPAEFTVRRQTQEILPGKPAEVLAYEVTAGGKSYVNPLLIARDGTAASVRLSNTLDEKTIIHWHGMQVDWRNDGHPSYAIGKGASYDYRFTVRNRGGSYWYHPHPHGIAGKQAYFGLAGLFVVQDENDLALRQRLDLQLGATDIPLAIQDRMLSADGSLRYASTNSERFSGFLGDLIAVNGVLNPSLDVQTRVYRFRVLNASTARSYRLMFESGSRQLPFQLIGTDGGLLERPVQLQEVFVSPGERVDLLVDLRILNPGDDVFLKSGTFNPMHLEMSVGGNMPSMPGHSMGSDNTQGMTTSRLEEGAEFNILRLAVKQRVAYDLSLPAQLSQIAKLDVAGAQQGQFTLTSNGSRWLVNGASFEMEKVLFEAKSGASEVWEISNTMMSMPHPMHLHGFLFQVLDRRNSPEQVRRLAHDPQGRQATDLGWKDTVLVWPGETVRLALKLDHGFTGEQLYTFHCHNLEHEDSGMMVNYRVV